MNSDHRCMRVQTIPSTYDIVGRVYSQDGLAPTINTLTDGGGERSTCAYGGSTNETL